VPTGQRSRTQRRRNRERGRGERYLRGRDERSALGSPTGPAAKKDLAYLPCPDCQHNELSGPTMDRRRTVVSSLAPEHKRSCATCGGSGRIPNPDPHDPYIQPKKG
jgi:hypothetical protein